MITFHCDKLCSGECCAPLRWALDKCEYAIVFERRKRAREAAALIAIDDPAKLAALMAMALRSRGVDVALYDQRGMWTWQTQFAVYPCWITVQLDPEIHGVSVEHTSGHGFDMTPTQAHAMLVAIMATPADDSSRDACERIIRGES